MANYRPYRRVGDSDPLQEYRVIGEIVGKPVSAVRCYAGNFEKALQHQVEHVLGHDLEDRRTLNHYSELIEMLAELRLTNRGLLERLALDELRRRNVPQERIDFLASFHGATS